MEDSGAIPANPIDLDKGSNITTSPLFVKESDLTSITGLAKNASVLRTASNQGNIQARQVEFEEKLRKSGAEFKHIPNVLDQYANYTYHIRWSLTDDISGSSVQNAKDFEQVRKVIIAESGATAGFNIVDFELTNICAPGPQTQTSLHTKFRMTLRELYGFSLIDKIYSISKTMGVKNHLTNSSFIEIWFTGYNEDGTIATPELQKSLYKLFRVIITKLDCDASSEGTKYTIEGIFDNMYANTDHIMISPSLNIGPVETVGDFFNQLETQLNIQQASLEYDFKQRVVYKFNVPDNMSSWKFSKDPKVSQRNNDLIKVQGKNALGNPTISISRGMDMNTILYFVISLTDDGQQYVAGEKRSPGSQASGNNSGYSLSANSMANIILIHSKCQLIGFDYLTNDYVRKITYTFTNYPTARALVDQQNAMAALQASQQKDKKNVLAKSGRYNKRYEYIYTGKNLDVIRFDIKLNWFWQTPIPNQLGENTYSNWTAPPQLNNKGISVNILNKYRDARSRLAKAKAERENLKKRLSGLSQAEQDQWTQEQISVSDQAVKSAEQEVASFGNSARTFQVLWDEQSPGQQALLGQSSNSDRLIRIGDRQLINDQQVLNDLKNQQVWKSTDNSRLKSYLEDVDSVVVETPLPISFRPTNEPINLNSTGGGDGAQSENFSSGFTPGNLPKGRSLVGTILNDVISSPYFAKIDLEIRGDPYWIGFGNVEEDAIMTSSSQIPSNTSQAAWFYNGDNGFYLTFRTGDSPNEETGFVEFSNSSIAFTGLYNVTLVISTFSNGQFRQTLSALRDNLYVPENLPTK